MTAPSYTTDLSTFDLVEAASTLSEFVNMADGGAPADNDTDDIIQGSYHASASCGIKSTELQSISSDAGSGVTIPTDGAILIWFKFDAGGILETYDNGGVRFVVGQTTTNWDAWKAGGSDKTPNPYGGWYNYALNPLARTYDYRNGTGTGTTYRYAGMGVNTSVAGPSKGSPFKMDGLRYGRCTIIIEYGALGDGYANFADAAAKNDANDATNGYNRWGLFQAVSGAYLWKGRMQIGTSSNACEFDDSDVLIFIDDVVNCTANFNTIEINNASTIVDWSNIIFKALGTTSPGRLVMNNNADMNIDACQFFDMGAFTFGGALSEFLNCVWSGCGQIDVNGGKLNGSQISGCTVDGSSTDEGAVIWEESTDPDGYLDDLTITKGATTHHAIEFGDTIPSSITIRNGTFSGYNASDSQYDSTFYFADTTGTITLNLVGCTGNVSVKTAGCTVNVVEDPVTLTVTVKDINGNEIENARVLLKVTNSPTGYPFPVDEVVTIANSGTTATVTHNSHGMATGDYVVIEGASHYQNNGVFSITKINDNSYSYAMPSDPGSSPSGTITCTYAALYGSSNASGIVTGSKVYSADQDVVGWARRSSGTPNYKTAGLLGTVDATGGFTATAVMIADE